MKVFFASHGRLASGMLSSLELFSHPGDKLRVYDAYVQEDEDEGGLEAQIDEFIAAQDQQEQILLVSDVYGGSVNTVMARYLTNERIRLVTGVNFPFLLELMSLTSVSDADLDRLIQQAREGLRRVELDDGCSCAVHNDESFF